MYQAWHSPVPGDDSADEPKPDVNPVKNNVPNEVGRPIGTTKANVYSREAIAGVFDLTKELYSNVQNLLKQKYNKKRLTKDQKKLAESVSEAIIVGSESDSWSNTAENVLEDPSTLDKLGVMKAVQDLAAEHDLNTYAAALLYHSNKKISVIVTMYKYITRFNNVVTASVNFDNNLLLSQASLEPIKGLIPKSVNLEKNVDLIGAAFNGAVVNAFNKNGDGIDTDTAIEFKNYFTHKPTNIEHKKQKVVGHIVNSAFSSFGENKILTDEDVKGSLDPFNIALAAVVYKTVDKDFAEALLESNDPDSNLYQKISASWEIGFNDYNIALGSDKLNEAEIITKKEQINEFKKYLRGFDGTGFTDDGTPVYRLVTGRIYPLGIGFTTNPAANVNGVIVGDGTQDVMDKNDASDTEVDNNTPEVLKIRENFSQNKKQPVNITKTNIMDLEQILSDLKTVLAEKQTKESFSEEAVANISAKIAESIKEKSEEIQSKIASAEEAKATAVAEAEDLKKSLAENGEKLDSALSKINELESILSAQAAQELFNSRMGILDTEYDFDDADRKLLAEELNTLDSSEEAFASYQEKLTVIYRHKSKAFKDEQEKIFQERLEAELAKRIQNTEEVEVAEASAEATEAPEPEVEVETALANAQTEEASLPAQNIEPTEEKVSWKDKLSKAFSKENITINF